MAKNGLLGGCETTPERTSQEVAVLLSSFHIYTVKEIL